MINRPKSIGRVAKLHCTECNQQISRRWQHCPFCGHEINYEAARLHGQQLKTVRKQSAVKGERRRRSRRKYSIFSRSVESAWLYISSNSNTFVKLGLLFSVILLCLGVWVRFIEPNRVQETRVTIPVQGLPAALEGFKIVQISDIHIRFFGPREKLAVKIANRSHPDVIAFTGDYAGGAWGERTDESSWELVRMIRHLHPRRAMFAVWGDWDYSEVLRARMRSAGVKPLFNSGQTLDVGGAKIAFLGLGLNIKDLNAAIKSVDPKSVKVLLCHEAIPESVDDAAERGVSLSLVGGEHGGQIRLPFIGPLRSDSDFGRKYMSGLHLIHDRMYLYASRGLGMSNLPIRFLCPPEVTILTLTRAKN